MIGPLIRLGLLLVVIILVYNFFFGTSSEKEQSKKIFGELRDVVVSVSGLVRSEREKFDNGKYDAALDKLGDAYRTVRERAKYVDENVLTRLEDLESRRVKLEQELDVLEQKEAAPVQQAPAAKKGTKQASQTDLKAAKEADLERRREQLQREMDRLIRDSDALLKQAAEQ